jgi:pimeloyl-ACP methyl ester carboxylesterase
MEEEKMKCEINGLSVYYESFGQGRPIVMLHGFYPDHRLMTGCMEPIFTKHSEYQRIYPDLPGMGRTKGAEWISSSDIMLEVVMEFIDRVLPGQNFLLAGESYGGYLARGIVHKWAHRVDGLMLLCPCVIADRAKRNRPPHMVIISDEKLLRTLSPTDAEEFSSMAVMQSEAIWRKYRDNVLSGVRIADDALLSKIQNSAYEFTFLVDKLAQPFEKPTLMLLGRQDASVGYKDAWSILDNYPRATFAVLDQAGHCLEIEQEGLFGCLVKEWLDRINTFPE